jgi:mRNA interferase RelE/StbE
VSDRRYSVRFKRSVAHDLKRLDAAARRLVRTAIRERLATDPRCGKRLCGLREGDTDRPLWSLRTGDYRIVYAFSDTEVWVLVVRIGHRRGAYARL